uniref:Reverse transcriptase domain-containing protein n=1 Tax=Panagrolaimus sp. ES5 TaxID=591445 RepID=A0AC34FUH3_9BILA
MDSMNNSRSPSPLRAGVSSSSSSSGSSSSDDSSRNRRRSKPRIKAPRSYSSSKSATRSPSPSHPSSIKTVPTAPVVRDDPRNPQDLLPTSLPGDGDDSKKIILNEDELVKFELWAKGTSPSNRNEYFEKIAKVNSVAHRAPYLQRSLRQGESVAKIKEQHMIEHHDLLYRMLTVATLIGKDGHDQEQVKNCLGSLISMGIHDVTIWRRWGALDALGFSKNAVPGSTSLLLDLKTHNNPLKDGDKIHHLFGPVSEELISDHIKRKDKDRKHRQKMELMRPRSVECLDLQYLSDSPGVLIEHKVPTQAKILKFAKIDASAGAGRLKNFIKNWRKITTDPFVIRALKGYRIPFLGSPPRRVHDVSRGTDPKTSEAEEEVKKLLEKKAIFEISKRKSRWISGMFFVPKKDGSLRPVINLKGLNKRLQIPHFKMEGLLTVKDILSKDSVMAKIDLKDAYFSIPIHKKHRKYLVFRALGKLYAFRALPFGLATAPFVYTRVSKKVAAYLRSLGIRLVVYLDDWLIIADSPKELLKQLDCVKLTFQSLGLIINWDKSDFTPRYEIEFLGLNLNSKNMTISVPSKKIVKLKEMVKKVLLTDSAKAKIIAGICGLLASFKLASEWSRLKARNIQRLLKSVTRNASGFNKSVVMTPEAKEELAFWLAAPLNVFENRLTEPPVSFVLRTDASKEGWGYQTGSSASGGRWTLTESLLHINVLELKAIYLSLRCEFNEVRNTSIRIESDNTTAVAFINRRGGTRSRRLHAVATDIWIWALSRGLHLFATHIAGKDNIDADYESRNFKESCEWELRSEATAIIFKKFGYPSIDLFASRANSKCETYFSWNPDPGAAGINAFAQNWQGLFGLAFPPFNLVARTIKKAVFENATVILIAPRWETAPFWPMLLKHSSQGPFILDNDPIKNPFTDDSHPLCTSGRLQLSVWKICSRYG